MGKADNVAVVNAYRATHFAMLGPDAAYSAADAAYRAQYPGITDPLTIRDQVVRIVMTAVVAAKGDFWKPRNGEAQTVLNKPRDVLPGSPGNR
jgi:hypothetical protein